jgi:N6-adenosine-specific RNA methylase IME4
LSAVLKYDAACRAIAEAKSVDEVTDWIDKAAAVREYGRRIRNRQIEIDAIEIRVRAKKRRGEILASMKAAGQIRRGQASKEMSSTNDISFTLDELGISRNESSEEQKIAAIPGDSFERLVARCRAYAEANPNKRSFDVLSEGRHVDKKAAREERERQLGESQRALPDKRYGLILADPEWRFATYSLERGMDRAADNHYPTSETDAICARPVVDIAADDCVLFLWATAPMLLDALRVMAAWGFEYKSHAIWKKDRIGTGYWFRNQHELLLVGTRGKVPAPAMGTQSASVIDAPLGEHSAKPGCFHDFIESYFPSLPKIELNARRARPGWDAWGYEAPLPPHDPETGEVIESAEEPLDVPDFLPTRDAGEATQ